MHLRRVIAALGLAAASLAVPVTAPAAADAAAAAAGVTMDERDCRESNVSRAVLTSELRQLVPERYQLLQVGPIGSRLVVTTYTCSRVSIDGQPVVGRDKSTTVTIGSAVVTHRDGEQLSSQQNYIIWYGTDNPVQFAKLQQTGLPISFLPRSSATVASDGVTTTVEWAIRGAGLDYDETILGTEPVGDPDAFTGTWWYDGPNGDLKITYNNVLARSSAVVSADFTGNELLRRIITSPTLLHLNGTTIGMRYARGSWTAQVSFE